ncbi:MOSC domain-containing protein YiiM [Amycolatopsis marina]|uniref:MOSC domain-containing protein YiiM n=1 Tax=Amycolatopsis marina TaxID=490629 RepID=A0A1I1AKU5_9PSEU|nr:MOSC domain-containing protein [Amycolatopsis marina]SFB38567.1 MOSC domain-containing protein YiiM [Amycolatopsis marina]
MGRLSSVNLGNAERDTDARVGVTGIRKRPVSGPVEVRAPGPRGTGGSGLAGDEVCDLRHHGGDDQAVYAYAEEDLAEWSAELGRTLGPGSFGENFTTSGLDLTAAPVGQRWQVGKQLLLEISGPRVPCRTFASALDVPGWVRTFTARARPGAYLRVLKPGRARADDPITIVHTPDHDITLGLAFRAITTERDLLPRLLVADALPAEIQGWARKAATARPETAR